MSMVSAKLESRKIPTYPLGVPEKNPLFFEKRVYQGSSGKVYPVPFIDKVFDEPVDQEYRVACLENEYVYLELLPEIGGRIFMGQDKTNANYDFFYRQDVIKPALVGLAGPWISGGVEFNWPQHHRPGTYMPADVFIEEEKDGARTVWMSEHDPLNRMKGMHGVRLRPGSSLVEVRVRLYNRTPLTQTFLWWANVAAKVHDNYQSFFPPDVHYVADHAVRAMSSFPEANNEYYGVNYSARSGANDLSWYRNIPVPTSYMICETQGGFFGGYDYDRQGGFVQVANRHISPGKKQWTWGNHPFGWAWDRELTDNGGPYVELMAGVYTDNQPDFSYLLPYETKTFSQFWWPIQKTGPVQEANRNVALRLVVREDRAIEAAVLVSSARPGVRIVLMERDQIICEDQVDLAPGLPWQNTDLIFSGANESALRLAVYAEEGELLGEYRPMAAVAKLRSREVAKEPAGPEAISSVEELFLVGEHLEQYRHPTRDPEVYWREGLRRDGKDSRCHLALGKAALKRGEFEKAKMHFETVIARWTQFHPNPASGEAHYFAGICSRFLEQDETACKLLFKATWNYEWRSTAYYELACIDLAQGRFGDALENVIRSLATNTENNKARVLQAIVLGKLDRATESKAELENLLQGDPLDAWANHELARLTEASLEAFGKRFRNDAQTVLDIAFDYAHAGQYQAAFDLLEWHRANPVEPVATPNPLERSQSVLYVMAWLKWKLGKRKHARELLQEANQQSPEYFFPSRLEEQLVLEWARGHSIAWLSCYALGNYYYDKRRHADAIEVWEEAVRKETDCATVYRNLGIACWNCRRDGTGARKMYQRAIQLDPVDARLIYEYDQLWKKLGEPVQERLRFLEEKMHLVRERDDLCVELADLLNQSRRFEDALSVLTGRRFHPWEGGEGKVLRQYTRAMLELGKLRLNKSDAEAALALFKKAVATPENLGEAYHLLQAQADVDYWMGKALQQLGRTEEAKAAFEKSASACSDFQDSAVVPYTKMSYFKGLSLIELGHLAEARELYERMLEYASQAIPDEPKIPYFATSLPNLLVFDEDLRKAEEERLVTLKELGERGLLKCRSRKQKNN